MSCGSPSFCVAVGNFGDEVTYDGSGWSAPTKIGILGYIQSVSCHSESFCIVETSEGEAAAYSGTTWSVVGHISERAASGGLSCVDRIFLYGGWRLRLDV